MIAAAAVRTVSGTDSTSAESALTPTMLTGAEHRRGISRACDECRRRKGKCRRTSPGTPKCDHCQDFDLACTFFHPGFGTGKRRKRQVVRGWPTTAIEASPCLEIPQHPFSPNRPPQIRQQSSSAGSNFVSQPEFNSSPAQTSPSLFGAISNVEYDNFLPVHSLVHSPILHPTSAISQEQRSLLNSHSDESIATAPLPLCSPETPPGLLRVHNAHQKYREHIEPYFPFINGSTLSPTGQSNELTNACILLAASTALDCPHDIVARLDRYLSTSSIQSLTENELRALLLVSLRISSKLLGPSLSLTIDKALSHASILAHRKESAATPPSQNTGMTLSLISCVLIVSVWRDSNERRDSMRVSSLPSAHGISILAQAMLTLSYHSDKLLYSEPTELLNAEFSMLLWPATLPPSLLYIDQNLSSIESSVLHIFHVSVLLQYYISSLQNPNAAFLEANLGLLTFIATMGFSCVKVWKIHGKALRTTSGGPLVSSITSSMLNIKTCMQDYECQLSRGVLVQFYLMIDDTDALVFGDLITDIRRSLGLPASESLKISQGLLEEKAYGTPSEQTDQEGRLAYWMFRDVRSMTLRGMLSKTVK